VGVSEYQSSGIPSLKYADKDAAAIADFLRKPEGGGYDSDHIRVLLNKDATLTNVKDALINFLAQAIDIDTGYDIFCRPWGRPNRRVRKMFIADHRTAIRLRWARTAFPMWDIQTVLARYINAKRVVVFADACHSGTSASNFATRGLSSTEDNLVTNISPIFQRRKKALLSLSKRCRRGFSEYPELDMGLFILYAGGARRPKRIITMIIR